MSTTTQLQIRYLDRTKGEAQLYHRYPRENQPQPVYISLDLETGVLEADWNASIGGRGTSERNFNGVELRWSVPCLRASAMNDLLDEIAPRAARVLAGAEVEWQNGNRRGQLVTEDASDAAGEIEWMCERVEREDEVQVWDAADYYAGLGGRLSQAADLGITAETTDAELAAIVERERAPEGEIDLIEDLDGYLAELREAVRDAAAEEGSDA